LMLCNADDDPVKEKEYIEMLMSKQPDGLIINTTSCNNELMKNVSRQMPVVLIDRKVPELNSDTVTVDSFRGACLAINYLIDLGHRDIAMFALPFRDISPRRERVEGYKQVLAERGIAFRPELLVEIQPSDTVVQERLQALLDLPVGRPTAVFGVNNLITMSLIKALKKMQVAISRDLAVIGFDDWEWAALLEPPVTVIAQPVYEMGAKAATLLIKRIKARNSPRKPALIVYQPQLIVRQSCGENAK
jgi:LacI family transcriptional regulator, kdg operon repressor